LSPERAVLRRQFVKGERERLLAKAFIIRVIVLMTLMPDADVREAVTALAGDLALVPGARPWARRRRGRSGTERIARLAAAPTC